MTQVHDRDEATEIISHFPLFPPLESTRKPVAYYLDATMAQIFEEYGRIAGIRVGKRIVAEAMARERSQLTASERIVCMSRWAARSVAERYQVNPRKIHVVPGGANICYEPSSLADVGCPKAVRPLRIGFIGKDWRRKNLQLVLRVAEILHGRNIPVEVIAAGFPLNESPRHPLLRSVGFIDKAREPERFAAVVRSFHFSCLFSTAEAFGIANRESLRLGVPVLTWDVGGMADSIANDCGHLFERSVGAVDIADTIESYCDCPELYWTLRDRVATKSETFGWGSSVQRLIEIWAGSEAYSYAALAETVE
jgi:glycosyltransferase involved in cell wall biosynthesis